jgi:hypothetical protein
MSLFFRIPLPSFLFGSAPSFLWHFFESFCPSRVPIGALEVKEVDTVCNVCNEGDFDADNEILLCDGCDIAVHQQCYGVQDIPPGAVRVLSLSHSLEIPGFANVNLLCSGTVNAALLESFWRNVLCVEKQTASSNAPIRSVVLFFFPLSSLLTLFCLLVRFCAANNTFDS